MPRSLTPSQRVAETQRRQLDQGWRRLNLRLRPEFARALDEICQRTGETPTALLSRLLADEAKKSPGRLGCPPGACVLYGSHCRL